MIKNCLCCGKEIIQKTKKEKRYCSKDCNEKHRRQLKRLEVIGEVDTRTCIVCGKSIAGAVKLKAKYCSDKCRIKYFNDKRSAGRTTSICKNCGKEFETYIKRPAKACSQVCRNRLLNEAKGIKARVPKPLIKCENCGIEFKPRRATTRFCSQKCRESTYSKKRYAKKKLEEAKRLKVKKEKVEVPMFKSEPMPQVTPKETLAKVIGRRNEKRVSFDDKAKRLQEEWLAKNKPTVIEPEFTYIRKYTGEPKPIPTNDYVMPKRSIYIDKEGIRDYGN